MADSSDEEQKEPAEKRHKPGSQLINAAELARDLLKKQPCMQFQGLKRQRSHSEPPIPKADHKGRRKQ